MIIGFLAILVHVITAIGIILGIVKVSDVLKRIGMSSKCFSC